MTFAIIGAGVAGLSCAEALAERGHSVRLFDKGRGPGGRMSTRRVEVDGATVAFDHGAQYVTARDPAFVARMERWEAAGVAARWPAAGPDAWVGTPGMNAMVKAMAADHDVRWACRVERIERADGGWRLLGEGLDEPGFDAVVIAVPAEQVAPLARPYAPALADRAEASRSQPCWTVMAAFDTPLPGPDIRRPGAGLAEGGPLGWAARDSAKPGRSADADCWVLQATPAWSAAQLEAEPEAIVPALFAALAESARAHSPTPSPPPPTAGATPEPTPPPPRRSAASGDRTWPSAPAETGSAAPAWRARGCRGWRWESQLPIRICNDDPQVWRTRLSLVEGVLQSARLVVKSNREICAASEGSRESSYRSPLSMPSLTDFSPRQMFFYFAGDRLLRNSDRD